MEIIKNIVKLTPEQYMELLKNGEVEVNGEIKTYSETTLYDTGNLELLEWYNKMMEAQHKELQPAHTPYTMKTLEQEIADIIKENPDYQSASCVGYRAYLKKGDIVGIKSTYNNGEWFINGKRVEANYSYNGSGTELVSVVGFDTKYYPVTLGATPSYFPYEIYIKNIGKVPEVSQYYYLYADTITTYNFKLEVAPRGCRVFKDCAKGGAYEQPTPVVVREVYSECDKLTKSPAVKAYTTKVSLPRCTEIICDSLRDLSVSTWEFGKLNLLQCTNSSGTMFYCSTNVYIPETVLTIKGIICGGNKTVRLDCKNATSIDSKWYHPTAGTPTNLYICDDWGATINLANAAKNQSADWFMELAGKLRNLEPKVADDLRYLTIPSSKGDELYELGFYDICEAKGWVVDEA